MISTNSRFEPRRLPVQWLDHSWAMDIGHSPGGLFPGLRARAGRLEATWLLRRSGMPGRKRGCPPPSGFTVLEMLIVVSIIGFLAAVAMPHLTGMTQANSMTAATQQMSAAVSLARQMAVSRCSTVYLVFDSPGAFTGPAPQTSFTTYSNLQSHQYTAYALMSLRSVGDQPGRPNPQYLTEWRTLPSGVFFPAYMFNNGLGQTIYTTNTLNNQVHKFTVAPFSLTPQPIPFPFANSSIATNLPCIAFSPQGQLVLNYDQFIPLARGAVQYLPGNAVNAIESPSGNSINDPNLIHIDSFTARAKIERNQF